MQHILRRELEASRREFSALGAAGLVLDISSGDVVGMVSLPDFDPNDPVTDTDDEARFNRVTKGVYEMGSTMKLFTVAMALDSGSTTLSGGYDATAAARRALYHQRLSSEEALAIDSGGFGLFLEYRLRADGARCGYYSSAAVPEPLRPAGSRPNRVAGSRGASRAEPVAR